LLKDLAQMKQGESGTIVDIQGGQGLIKRLESLGIRPGVKITKLTAQFMRGPVTMRISNSRIAVGFGMAKKIVVRKDGL
jgi:ferrous iron transport protein A